MNDEAKYQKLLADFRAEYDAARAEYSAVVAAARVEEEALEDLKDEREGIQARMAAFRAGTLFLSGDEYAALATRAEYLSIRISQQATVARQAQKRAEGAGVAGLSIVHGKYQSRLRAMVKEDVEEVEARRWAEFNAAIKG